LFSYLCEDSTSHTFNTSSGNSADDDDDCSFSTFTIIHKNSFITNNYDYLRVTSTSQSGELAERQKRVDANTVKCFRWLLTVS